jgi:hypothetical protein
VFTSVQSQGKIRFGQRLRQLVQKRPASQILVFVTLSAHTKHSTGHVMTAGSNAVRSVEHLPNLKEVPPNSAAFVIDFFEARHRLLTESERIAQESAIDRQIQEPAIRRERSVGLVDALEEAFYWLILAATLAYLALGIFGLSNFTLRARTPAVDAANYQAATTGAYRSRTIVVSNKKI